MTYYIQSWASFHDLLRTITGFLSRLTIHNRGLPFTTSCIQSRASFHDSLYTITSFLSRLTIYNRGLPFTTSYIQSRASHSTSGKKPTCHAGDRGDAGLIPGSGRPPGGGHGNPLHYSCLENPVDRSAWRATVHRVAKNWTRLSD